MESTEQRPKEGAACREDDLRKVRPFVGGFIGVTIGVSTGDLPEGVKRLMAGLPQGCKKEEV